MATEIAGCRREFDAGELVFFYAKGHGVVGKRDGEALRGKEFVAWKYCGYISTATITRGQPPAVVGGALTRALCKECAVKDGVSW
jgi:hypothetical protein